MAEATDATEAPSPPPPPAAPPTSPEVLRMENAHARGDFHEARALARRLAASDDAAPRERGQAMLERHRVDPVIVAVLVATGALIVALAGLYLGHPQHPTAPRGRSAAAGAPRGARR